MGMKAKAAKRLQFPITLFIIQVVFVVLIWKYVNYGDSSSSLTMTSTNSKILDNRLRYPMFQDVHVMIFIGFGFLMTFLSKYGFSAVSYNLLLSVVAIQWSTIVRALIHDVSKGGTINYLSLILSDFDCAIVLISFGAVLGKTSPMQLLLMVLFEIPIAQANTYLAEEIFHAADIGGSMILHTFGAYFGVAAALSLNRSPVFKNKSNVSTIESDIFAMIGTIFLWVFWPSFNGALGDNDLAERAVINTYFALTGATIATFIFSTIAKPRGKFKMVMIQNATIAGGVGVGAVANFMIHPYGAILVGFAAGTISVFGYSYLQGVLEKICIHDTCGVHNLHGMPGVMSGIASVIAAAIATKAVYSDGLYVLFPKRAPVNATTIAIASGPIAVSGSAWTASHQATMQLATLGCTLLISIVGGLIVGGIMRLPFLDQIRDENLFDDQQHWEVPEKELPQVEITKSSYTINTSM